MSLVQDWIRGRPDGPPGPGDVHLWAFRLSSTLGAAREDERLLSADERERAARFVFERHRARYVTARAGLRRLLGAYLDRLPESLSFVYGPAGKPALPSGGLDFNIAHSEDRALAAIAWERPVGVDLEAVRELSDAQAIAARSFSPAEAAALARLPAGEHQWAFFRVWTRKEALLKAAGEGISSEGLRETEVGWGAPWESGGWSLAEVDAGPGYAAAVAVRGPLEHAIARHWGER